MIAIVGCSVVDERSSLCRIMQRLSATHRGVANGSSIGSRNRRFTYELFLGACGPVQITVHAGPGAANTLHVSLHDLLLA